MAGFGRVVLCGKYILVIFEEESKQPGFAQHKGMQRKGMPHNGMQCRANLLRGGEGKGCRKQKDAGNKYVTCYEKVLSDIDAGGG